MTVKEAAEYANVSIKTIYAWIASGKLSGIARKRFDSMIIIDETKFKQWVAVNG